MSGLAPRSSGLGVRLWPGRTGRVMRLRTGDSAGTGNSQCPQLQDGWTDGTIRRQHKLGDCESVVKLSVCLLRKGDGTLPSRSSILASLEGRPSNWRRRCSKLFGLLWARNRASLCGGARGSHSLWGVRITRRRISSPTGGVLLFWWIGSSRGGLSSCRTAQNRPRGDVRATALTACSPVTGC